MGNIGGATFEIQTGLHSVRTWMDYAEALTEEEKSSLLALEKTLESLKETASEMEDEAGSIFSEVEKDVEGRMEDWSKLEGSDAEDYVERCAAADEESLRAIEDAYTEGTEVTAEDLAYTRLSVQMLGTLFELRRMQEQKKKKQEPRTVYEDTAFARATRPPYDTRRWFLLFRPTMEEVCEAVASCLGAICMKYLGGEFPLLMEMQISFGHITPETKEDCIAALKQLDDYLVSRFDFDKVTRTYSISDKGGCYGEYCYEAAAAV